MMKQGIIRGNQIRCYALSEKSGSHQRRKAHVRTTTASNLKSTIFLREEVAYGSKDYERPRKVESEISSGAKASYWSKDYGLNATSKQQQQQPIKDAETSERIKRHFKQKSNDKTMANVANSRFAKFVSEIDPTLPRTSGQTFFEKVYACSSLSELLSVWNLEANIDGFKLNKHPMTGREAQFLAQAILFTLSHPGLMEVPKYSTPE